MFVQPLPISSIDGFRMFESPKLGKIYEYLVRSQILRIKTNFKKITPTGLTPLQCLWCCLRNRACLFFRGTWWHPQFLVGVHIASAVIFYVMFCWTYLVYITSIYHHISVIFRFSLSSYNYGNWWITL